MSLHNKLVNWAIAFMVYSLLLLPTAQSQSVIQPVSVLELGQQSTSPGNPPASNAYIYYNSSGTAVCIKPDGTSCFVGGGGSASWGSITGTLSNQTDLQTALNAKAPLASPSFTGTYLLTGSGSLTSSSVNSSGAGTVGTFADEEGSFTSANSSFFSGHNFNCTFNFASAPSSGNACFTVQSGTPNGYATNLTTNIMSGRIFITSAGTYSTSGAQYGLNIQNYWASSGNMTGSLANGLVGIELQPANISSAGTVTNEAGMQIITGATGTGAVTNDFGIFTDLRRNGPISHHYGFYCENGSDSITANDADGWCIYSATGATSRSRLGLLKLDSLTASRPVYSDSNQFLASGTFSGNTTTFGTTTGTLTSGNLAKFDASGNIADSGVAAANAGGAASCSTVSFSATPTFNAASTTLCFKLTLTGDVTSSTFSNGASGNNYTFIICQDSTGSRAFVPPTSMHEYSTWRASASSCSIQTFAYDGTNLNAVAPWTEDTRPFTAKTIDEECDGNAVNTSSKWTWTNQGTSTFAPTDFQSCLFLPQQGANAFAVRYISQAVPVSTPWTVMIKTKVFNNGGNGNQRIGLCVSDGTKLVMLDYLNPNMQVSVDHYATVTSTPTNVALSTASSSGGISWANGSQLYLQIQDDGTNLNVSFGSSRNKAFQLWTELRGSFLSTAPTTVGICGDGTNAAASTILLYQDVKWFRQIQ